MDDPTPSAPASQRAFSLIELITLVAVAAVLLGAGIPGFRQLTASSAMTGAAGELMAHLQLARSEAILRDLPVVVCPSPDGLHCDDTSPWNQGLMIFADRDGDRRRQPQDPLIRHHRPAGRDILISTSRWRRRLLFRPSGSATGSAATFTLCHRDGTAAPRAVIVSNTGRPRIDRTRPDGGPLRCGQG